MKRTLIAEFRKLRYQRSTRWLLLASALFALLSTISSAAALRLMPEMHVELTQQVAMQAILAKSTAGYIFALVIGIMIAAGEYRHSTAIATYLAQPHRIMVMVAKIITGAIAGLVFQFISTSVSIGGVLVYLQQYEHYALAPSDYLRTIATACLSGLVMAVVGVGLGTLLRNVTMAITGALVWLLLVESLLVVFADWLGKWLITGAVTAMFNLSIDGAPVDFNDFLPPWGGVAVLVGYAALFSLAAIFTTLRRDID